MKFYAVAVIGAAVSVFSARAQQDIPLSLETIGNSQRLVIYAGINGGAAEPYLFDTGSSGFNAAYYNGAYSGSGTNPAAWTSTSTISTNATASYGTATSGFSYILNAVTVPSIQIYRKTDLAHAILGLDSAIRSQFTSSVAWTATGTDPFPNSGAMGSTEFGGGKFDFVLSGGGNTPVTWTNGTLLDAGTQNNNLNAKNSSSPDLSTYETSPPLVDAGYTITAAGNGAVTVSDTYGFTTTTGGLETYNANVKPDAAANDHSTLGIGFFLADSVAFDLQNQQTLYTSNVVAVPEPGSFALLGFAAAGLLGVFGKRARR